MFNKISEYDVQYFSFCQQTVDPTSLVSVLPTFTETFPNKRESRVCLIVFFCRSNLRQQTSDTKLTENDKMIISQAHSAAQI